MADGAESAATAFGEESMTLLKSTAALVLALGVTVAAPALAQKKYDTGASDTEIKVGQTIPLSGPASAYGSIGKVQAAYIRMINEQGGVNGRKINLIQYDDAYNPPKTVEQVRKLVEGDEVLTTFQIIGTPPNAAVQKYLNDKKKCRSFWPRPARHASPIQSIFHGRSPSTRTTSPKATSTQNSF
jgi:ABC-type branched-subunit amino acid transport system substrate-binding protein